MSLYQNIRGALQTRAALAAGFPPANQRAHEGMVFTSTTGVPYARLSLIPSSARPFALSGQRRQHRGLFQVDVFYPANKGTGPAETVADAIRDQFKPGDRIPLGADIVLISYSERAAALFDAAWTQIPVTVGWSCLTDKT